LAADRGIRKIIAIAVSPANYITLNENIESRPVIKGINRAVWTKNEEKVATCSEEEFRNRVIKTNKALNHGGWHGGKLSNPFNSRIKVMV